MRRHSSSGILTHRRRQTGDSGVVHQDVELALARQDAFDGRPRAGRVRDVQAHRECTPARIADPARLIRGRRLVHVGDGHAVAVTGEPGGDGSADAAASPGHQ